MLIKRSINDKHVNSSRLRLIIKYLLLLPKKLGISASLKLVSEMCENSHVKLVHVKVSLCEGVCVWNCLCEEVRSESSLCETVLAPFYQMVHTKRQLSNSASHNSGEIGGISRICHKFRFRLITSKSLCRGEDISIRGMSLVKSRPEQRTEPVFRSTIRGIFH